VLVGSLFSSWPHVDRSIDCHGLLIHLVPAAPVASLIRHAAIHSSSSSRIHRMFRTLVIISFSSLFTWPHADRIGYHGLLKLLLHGNTVCSGLLLFHCSGSGTPVLSRGKYSRGPLSIPIGLHGLLFIHFTLRVACYCPLDWAPRTLGWFICCMFVDSLFTWSHVDRSIDCHGLLIQPPVVLSTPPDSGSPVLLRS
jgi:hypothetical protein